jgi:hypothetical protein
MDGHASCPDPLGFTAPPELWPRGVPVSLVVVRTYGIFRQDKNNTDLTRLGRDDH